MLQMQTSKASTPALQKPTPTRPVKNGLVQRQCAACGGTPGPSGECEQCRKKRLGALQPSANGMMSDRFSPPLVLDVLQSPGQTLDEATSASMAMRFGHNFGHVRIHTDAQAAKSAQAVNALAYTVGNEIVFGAGQYAPDTSAGRKLIAHELTHVVQQSRAQKSQPVDNISGDAHEKEAEHISEQVNSGNQVGAIQAASGNISLQRTEDPALRTRRLEAASRLRVSIGRFRSALSGGLQWGFERISPQGNQMTVGNTAITEPMANRQSRLTALLRDMVQLTIVLESGPIPAAWLNPQVSIPAGTFEGASVIGASLTNFGSGPEWEDPLRFFANWQVGRGQDSGALNINLFYIPDPPLAGRTAAIPRVAMQGGINLGIYIVVPDVDNQPMQYRRLTSTEAWPAAGTIFEIWHDSIGYYYLNNMERHYLPGRP